MHASSGGIADSSDTYPVPEYNNLSTCANPYQCRDERQPFWQFRRQTREPIRPELSPTSRKNTLATTSTSDGGRQDRPPSTTGGISDATRYRGRKGSLPGTA